MPKASVSAAGAELPERVAQRRMVFQEGVGEEVDVGGVRTAGEAAKEDESVGGIAVATLVCLEKAMGVGEGRDTRMDGDLEGGRHGESCWILVTVLIESCREAEIISVDCAGACTCTSRERSYNEESLLAWRS